MPQTNTTALPKKALELVLKILRTKALTALMTVAASMSQIT
jgi:hypothetical protein